MIKDNKASEEIKSVSAFLEQNHQRLFLLAVSLFLLLGLLTFNLRISEGGDDSSYIMRAYDFLKEGRFPTYQGPLYPIVLSLFIAVFGLKISVLKVSSLLFLSTGMVFFYRSFKGHVSPIALFGSVLAVVVNHHFLYYGSQTYSEAFFFMVQGCLFVCLSRIIREERDDSRLGEVLLLSLLLVALAFTRTVGFAALPALVVFYVVRRQFREAAWSVVFFTVCVGALFLLQYVVFDVTPFQGGQAESLLHKHPYDFSSGGETFTGFLERFVANSHNYLSRHFVILTGFKAALSLAIHKPVTLVLYVVFGVGLWQFRKKHPLMLFTGFYLFFMLGSTFVSLQPLWNQQRLIIPFFPLMLLFLSEIPFSVSVLRTDRMKAFVRIPTFLLVLSIVLSLGQTIRHSDFKAVWENLAGDPYYGYTPDWEHYLQMAVYCGDHLSPKSYVACRKPNMARLFGGGKKFYGIYRFQSEDPDTLLHRLTEKGVTHVLVGSLRKNPHYNSGQVINTIHRYLAIINKKYPRMFVLSKRIGDEEPAWLLRVEAGAGVRRE